MDSEIPARVAQRAFPARSLPAGVRRFLDTEAASGLVLVAAATVALVWANSPWDHSYERLWHTAVDLRIGTFGVDQDLRHFVNDGLMALFFVVVALEVKREIVVGDLRSPRVAALPAVAAAGGMVVPAAIYWALNAGGPGESGWGIPVATDIAFALGVCALLGPRVPPSLKLFLLSLAIVDDIGAIVLIAVVYTEGLDPVALGLAAGTIAAAIVLRQAHVWWPPAFVALGLGCWLALHDSGVHPTLAGIAFGLLAPARPIAPTEVARRWASDLSDEPTAGELREMTVIARATVSVAERVQHLLHPVTSYAVVPLFALANAGVPLTVDPLRAPGAAPVAAGVAVGLVAGKTIGITGATVLATRLGFAKLPNDVEWPQLFGIAVIAGIGFTVSLFVTGLAFADAHLQDAARLAILTASVTASLLGAVILHRASRRTRCRHPAAG